MDTHYIQVAVSIEIGGVQALKPPGESERRDFIDQIRGGKTSLVVILEPLQAVIAIGADRKSGRRPRLCRQRGHQSSPWVHRGRTPGIFLVAIVPGDL